MFRKKKGSFSLDEVLDGCLKNKGSAQRQLYEKYYGFAKSICLRYASNGEEAVEMVNDGFLKVFSRLHLFDRAQSFEAWFKTVIVRTSIDYYRKNHAKVGFVDVDEFHYLAYDDELLERLTAEEILELIQKLPPTYRTVFSLFVVEGYTHAEIATQLGINEGTSRSNLAKARIKMQEMVKIYVTDITQYKNV